MRTFPLATAQRIDLPEAKAYLDRGEALFIDVRAENAYQAGHIPGAINMLLRDLPARSGNLSSDRPMIFY